MNHILVIHGPNLNLIGTREPGIYGKQTIESINRQIVTLANSLGLQCEVMQSNYEGAIIDAIQQSVEQYDGIILNAGAYTHYSYAIRDAIAAVKTPVVEVHLSNIHAREAFRENSVISAVCAGSIIGFGADSYLLAVHALKMMIEGSND